MAAKRKRLDGVGNLTKAQKDERDARAMYWMQQRKIERLAEATFRSGYSFMASSYVEALIDNGNVRLADDGELVLIDARLDEFRVCGYVRASDSYKVRKILTHEEETIGSDE